DGGGPGARLRPRGGGAGVRQAHPGPGRRRGARGGPGPGHLPGHRPGPRRRHPGRQRPPGRRPGHLQPAGGGRPAGTAPGRPRAGGAAMSQDHPLILVVEDDAPLRRTLRATLQAFGYGVEEAATGAEGRDKLLRLNPQVVLLDLGLPDGDGLDLAREIRGWSEVPIIVVSARGKEADKIQALDLGADDYLTKPFGSGELLARIRVALRHWAQAGGPASEPVAEV